MIELTEDTNLYEGDTFEVITAVKHRGEDVDPEDIDGLTVYHLRPDGTREVRTKEESEIVEGAFRTVFTLLERGTHRFASVITYDGARKSVEHDEQIVRKLKDGD